MSNSPNFNSNDKLENIIKALADQLLTKEDLKGIHYKLNQVIETFRHNLSNPEFRGGMNPFNQRGNQMSGFFNSGNPFSEMPSNPSENPQMAMQPPAGPGVNMFKNSKSFKINPFNMDDGVSSNETMNHPSDDIIIALYHAIIDGKIIGREALPPMSQQPTMPNSVKSNPLSGAFPDPQLTPDQVKINVLEKRLRDLEILVERVIPRLETLEKQSSKKANVSEPKIEGGDGPYRDIIKKIEAHIQKRRDTKTADKGEVKVTGVYGPFTSYNQPKMYLENKEEIDPYCDLMESLETYMPKRRDAKTADVKLDGNVWFPPKMYLENKEEIDKIHEKLKDVETIEDVRSLDLMYLVLSSLYSCYHDFTSANELLFKLRRGVGLLKILEDRGLHLTYPQVFNNIANHIASRN